MADTANRERGLPLSVTDLTTEIEEAAEAARGIASRLTVRAAPREQEQPEGQEKHNLCLTRCFNGLLICCLIRDDLRWSTS